MKFQEVIRESDEEYDLRTMLETQKHVLGNVIPRLRSIAVYTPDVKKELLDIANQLASLQWKIHGEKERNFGQAWSDVERRDPLWKDKV